jgi:tripartite ATP-independent transporter DctM subunit
MELSVNHILVISMFICFIALLFTGFPIAFVLAGVSILFTVIGYFCDLYLGTATGLEFRSLGLIVQRIYRLMDNWVLVAIPMFIFMGLMLDHTKMAEQMMRSMEALFGKVAGGLAVVACIIGIVLAASTGIIASSIVLLGTISLPVMLRQGYNQPLALGTICASGTLGILIPPSIMLVVMADQLALPVGDLFMGAVIPGLILGFLYILYILIYGFLKPEQLPLAKDRTPFTWIMVWEALKSLISPVALILLVLGSIFLGVATPTEASGLGAFGTVLLAARHGKLSFQTVKEVTLDTFKMTGFVFAIFVGASSFALVLRFLGGDEVISMSLMSIPLGPYGVLGIILIVVFILGYFLDWIEITLIILPLITPVVSQLGLSVEGFGKVENPTLVWFAICIAVCLQTSFLTPPVGFAIFFVQGIAPKDIQLIQIYKGIIPFVILQL